MPASTGSQGGEAWTLTQECAGSEGGRGGGLGWDLAPDGLTAQLTRTSKRLLLEAAGPTRFVQRGFGETQAFFGMGSVVSVHLECWLHRPPGVKRGKRKC